MKAQRDREGVPDRPGAWLAAFRRQLTDELDRPVSPETLAAKLGVSGATIRRWEAGGAAPSSEDLAHIASACELNSTQVSYLKRSFGRTGHWLPVEPARFPAMLRTQVEPHLRAHNPRILFDSLMYARAWNSYVDALWPEVSYALGSDKHPLELACRMVSANGRGERWLPALRRLVSFFWLYTAPASGEADYRRLIQRLCERPGFQPIWSELGNPQENQLQVIEFGQAFDAYSGARFRSHPVAVIGEPRYTLFEFEPANDAAEERVHNFRECGGAIPLYHRNATWIQ